MDVFLLVACALVEIFLQPIVSKWVDTWSIWDNTVEVTNGEPVKLQEDNNEEHNDTQPKSEEAPLDIEDTGDNSESESPEEIESGENKNTGIEDTTHREREPVEVDTSDINALPDIIQVNGILNTDGEWLRTSSEEVMTEKDVLYYRINLFRPGKLSLSFNCLGDGLQWSLYDYDLQREFFTEAVWDGTESEPKPGESRSFYLDRGAYYIKVNSWPYGGHTGRFWLMSEFVPANSTEVEPNQIPDQADDLTFNEMVRGVLTEQDGDDYYGVEIQNRRKAIIRLTSYMDGAWIRLYNNSLDEIDLNDDAVIWNGSAENPITRVYTVDFQMGYYYIHMAPWQYGGNNGVYSIEIQTE